MTNGQPNSSGDADKVGTVSRAFEAFGRRDVPAVLALMHPQVRVWVVTGAVVREGRPYVGHAGIREYFSDVGRLWQSLELHPIETYESGDAVVVLGEVHAWGAAGELRQPTVWTWKFTDGLVIDCRVDSDLTAARDALGEAKTVDDLLRSFVAAFNRREVDAMIALADPTIVTYPSRISRTSRRYLGHQGLRHWIRDVLENDQGQTIAAREVRKLEQQHWALLGEVTMDAETLSPFASLFGVTHGLITEAREYLSEESLLRELDYLP
jgi:ketosteroid isomerase-like protein